MMSLQAFGSIKESHTFFYTSRCFRAQNFFLNVMPLAKFQAPSRILFNSLLLLDTREHRTKEVKVVTDFLQQLEPVSS